VSRSALARNARLAVGALSVDADRVGDLRADAWGHGAPVVAQALLQAGARLLLVDDDHAAARLAAHGIPGLTTTATTDIDPLTVFGLPGGSSEATPAMSLTGTVLSTKPLRAGEGVSYGYTYRAPEDTRVALVSGGYAQGIVRSLGNRATVRIGGVRHRVVGRVAMDACVVEIGRSEVRRGDVVRFFGEPARDAPGRDAPGIGDWAKATGLSPGELVAAVGLHALREDVA
jgi:alanine racemase